MAEQSNDLASIVKDSQLFIFDLDGTLYADTDHFDYYASLLRDKLPLDKQEDFSKAYEAMKEGQHPVKIGTAYDVTRDCILTVDAMSVTASAVCDWDGTVWSEAEVKGCYPEPLIFDFEHLIAIGDGWWLPYTAARHFGLSGEDVYECYQATKAFMVTDQFHLTQMPGLREGLAAIKDNKYSVLMTNSDIDDVQRLLKELNLQGLFHDIIASAQKPAYTQYYFKQMLDKYGVSAEESVSIGDNFMNEVAPALTMHMKGIYIQPLEEPKDNRQWCVIPRITDMIQAMP